MSWFRKIQMPREARLIGRPAGEAGGEYTAVNESYSEIWNMTEKNNAEGGN